MSVASSAVESQVSEDWSSEEEEDTYDDYYGKPLPHDSIYKLIPIDSCVGR